jgi:hypothetical protein
MIHSNRLCKRPRASATKVAWPQFFYDERTSADHAGGTRGLHRENTHTRETFHQELRARRSSYAAWANRNIGCALVKASDVDQFLWSMLTQTQRPHPAVAQQP